MISYGYLGGAMIGFRSDKAHDLNMSERMLVIALCSYANKDGKCWPTRKELARVTGGSLATVKRLLKVLEKKGYISIFQRQNEKGEFTSNLYHINIEKHVPKDKTVEDKVVSISSHQTTEEKLFDRSWADHIDIVDGL
ncbi:MAG: helix-turn-helix domain-containing protein [Shewanella sp.]|nr:helix-turn-helix domain-containing protein [Shewanella sp.]MCF1457207.1 helix-turn-helix domain-containing protein [Shewanella sp.]